MEKLLVGLGALVIWVVFTIGAIIGMTWAFAPEDREK